MLDTSNQVLISKTKQWREDNATVSKHLLDSKGQIHYSIIDASRDGFSIKVTYLDADESLGWIAATDTIAGVYLQASLKTEK